MLVELYFERKGSIILGQIAKTFFDLCRYSVQTDNEENFVRHRFSRQYKYTVIRDISFVSTE